jgi:hypothetical protein
MTGLLWVGPCETVGVRVSEYFVPTEAPAGVPEVTTLSTGVGVTATVTGTVVDPGTAWSVGSLAFTVVVSFVDVVGAVGATLTLTVIGVNFLPAGIGFVAVGVVSTTQVRVLPVTPVFVHVQPGAVGVPVNVSPLGRVTVTEGLWVAGPPVGVGASFVVTVSV